MTLQLKDVFGIRTNVSDHSYIDRGGLDEEIASFAKRDMHIALRGESKSGKSWLRQKIFTDPNIVPCRLGHSTSDIYRQVLANLGIDLLVETNESGGLNLSFSGTSELGWFSLAKAKGTLKAGGKYDKKVVKKTVGRDEFDLAFLSAVITASGKRVIIEDFHYLGAEAQRELAHELKTFWDYNVYFVIIGVWHRKNYITHLNPDVAGRVHEASVYWTEEELVGSIDKGAKALKISISEAIKRQIARDSYNNVGILQSLIQLYCEKVGVIEELEVVKDFSDEPAVESAGMAYADQIEAVYQLFAEKVSEGIRKRKDATQIYAYAMQTLIEASDNELIDGLSVDEIFKRTSDRQERIQKVNLRTILRKFRELQVDDRGKGLVLTFDEPTDAMIIVDRGLLFYRKYMTVAWPFERIIADAEATEVGASPPG